MTKDIFDKDNEVQPNFWKLTEVGQSVTGVLVDKRISLNTLKKPNCKQTIYTLVQEDGTPIMIGGRGNADPQVISGLEQCKIGQYVGVKYIEDRPSTTSGMHDAKILRVYTNGKMEQEVLDKYRGVDVTEEDAADVM